VTIPDQEGHVKARAAARGRSRTAIAAVILIAWVAGLVLLARREFFTTDTQKLAAGALNISPGASFYVVEQSGRQIGFASTTIDTVTNGIEVTDYFVADLPIGAETRRASARSVVKLSRALALRTFDVQVDSPDAPRRSGGRAEGDSAVVFRMETAGQPADTQRIAVKGPIYLPTLVPLAVILSDKPRVGKKYSLPTFNPTTMTPSVARLQIKAESLFTLIDSATFNPATRSWESALTDTVRAWKIEPEDAGGGFSGWVDGQGRVVQSTQPGGITLKRMAYEIAFENWRIATAKAKSNGGRAQDNILDATAISAGVDLAKSKRTALKLKLSGTDFRGFDLDGGRQTFSGDVLTITEESKAGLVPSWSLLANDPAIKKKFAAELSPEPLLQSNDLRMVQTAIGIAGPDRDVRVIAEKINTWVYKNLKKEITVSIPNALAVLNARKGDCNEHTQLYTALARGLGIPTRIASGLAFVNGKFYYHEWPEVYINDWVAVDPTFGQFPADASHVRFVVGGLAKQTELLRLMGTLKISVLSEGK
jgi:hypothetical protein